MTQRTRLFGLLALGLSGCRGCDRDKPYVPYTIDSAPTGSAPAPPNPSGAASAQPLDGGTFTRTFAHAAPPGTSTWTLGGLAVAAPPGRVFLFGLVLAEGDKPPAAVAFVGDGGSMAGEVVLYRKGTDGAIVGPTTLAKLPDWMPVGSDCRHVTHLAQVGPSTVWLDVVAACNRTETKKPHRYLAALSTTLIPALRMDLRTAEIPPGERLAVEADGSDRDGDQVDDLVVHVSLEGAPTPLVATTRASTQIRFLGRDGGLSREAGDPGQALGAAARWQASLSSKKAHEEAQVSARQIRRLHAHVCAEGGAPTLTLGDGTALQCQDVSITEDTRFAEARAHLAAGRLPIAFAQAGRFRVARPKSKRTTELDAAFDVAAPPRRAKARPITAQPTAASVALPLAFEASGKLLVLTNDAVVRVDPATGEETVAEGVARWNTRADLVGDLRVHGGFDPCKADFLRIHVKSGAGGLRELVLPFLGSSPPVCSLDSTGPLFLLDRNADGLTVALLGEPVSISADGERAQAAPWPTGAPPPGSVRSPDGRWLAMSAGDRVLVKGPERPEIWRPNPFFTLNACTVANDGKAVACVLDKGAVMLTP